MLTKKIGIGALLLMTGCASVGPSQALIEARQMREKALSSLAPDLAPDQLRQGELLLAEAESSNAEHEAYLAADKFQTAIADARRRDASQREEIALRRVFTEQARLRRTYRGQIAELQKDHLAVQSQIETTQAELDAVKLRLESQTDLGASQTEQLRQEAQALEEQIRALTAKRAALEQSLTTRDAQFESDRTASAAIP